jgi:hypothetical protein
MQDDLGSLADFPTENGLASALRLESHMSEPRRARYSVLHSIVVMLGLIAGSVGFAVLCHVAR